MSDVKMSSVKWCDHIQIYLAPYRGYFCLLSRREGNEADISGVLAGAKLLGDGLKANHSMIRSPVPGDPGVTSTGRSARSDRCLAMGTCYKYARDSEFDRRNGTGCLLRSIPEESVQVRMCTELRC